MSIGPISLFDRVENNRPSDCEVLDFDSFVAIMEAYAEEEFESKVCAPLICATAFKNGRRSKASATKSGLVVLDIDDHLTIEAVTENLNEAGISALLCSTASHRTDHHKFRVFVPLSEVADYEDHVLVWHVINHAVANGKADPSKIGCESMFYVPGTYPKAPGVFERFDGEVMSASEWIDLVGEKSDVLTLAGKPPKQLSHSTPRNRSRQHSTHSTVSDSDLDLSRSRLVTDKALDNYRCPSGSYHHARFTLLMSMAGRARLCRINVSASELLLLFNQIDLEDGGHYQTPKHQFALLAEAKKAISTP